VEEAHCALFDVLVQLVIGRSIVQGFDDIAFPSWCSEETEAGTDTLAQEGKVDFFIEQTRINERCGKWVGGVDRDGTT
jgi:hypothetical protein